MAVVAVSPLHLGMLALGHLLAMLVILLPFSVMSSLFIWEKELRMGSGIMVLLMGLYLLTNRKHPRFLAKIDPTRLALCSFLIAMAHGAGLMLVPIHLVDRSGNKVILSEFVGRAGKAFTRRRTGVLRVGTTQAAHSRLLLSTP